MSESHGNLGLKVYGTAPEIEKLQNDRYRVVVRVMPPSKTRSWYYDNRDLLFRDFGDLYSAVMELDGVSDGWEPNDGEEYPDQILIDTGLEYMPDGTWVVRMVYETITDEWVQVKDDTVDYELNGLRRVTRQSIALVDTAYTGIVGSTTITDGGETLTLGTYSIDERDSHWVLTEAYVEAGTLSVSKQNRDEGVVAVTTVFLVTEGPTTGPVVSRRTDNFEGLQTITVTTLQDKDGNAIGDGDGLVHQYTTKYRFQYPGIAGIEENGPSTVAGFPDTSQNFTITAYHFRQEKLPIVSNVDATAFVFYQTTDSIVPADETYDGASGYWNPDQWAVFNKEGVATNLSSSTLQPISQTKGLHQYTTNTGTQLYSGVSGTGAGTSPAIFLDGAYIYPVQQWEISVSGGPGIPDGNKYTLDIQVRPAFEDVDGTTYYKKVIIVATIPTRT